MDKFFSFLLIAISPILINSYDKLYYLQKDGSFNYEGTYSSLTVLDVSQIEGNTIYLEYKIENEDSLSCYIKYNFTDEYITSPSFSFSNDIIYSQKVIKEIRKDQENNYTEYVLYYNIPRENKKKYIVFENPRAPNQKITITNFAYDKFYRVFMNGLISKIVSFFIFVIILICAIKFANRNNIVENEYKSIKSNPGNNQEDFLDKNKKEISNNPSYLGNY